jgi:geranylgeranyl diphosphate synthase type II
MNRVKNLEGEGLAVRQQFASWQNLVNEALTETLARHKEGVPTRLWEAISYGLLAPGKRLRPILVLCAARACGASESVALPAAVAVELVHTYSLIHDDLPAMDDDDLRRGLPTTHKKFGEALGILAGDALLTLAFRELSTRLPPDKAMLCCAELSQGAGLSGMVGGQVLDLAAEGRIEGVSIPQTIESLEEIHSKKTGALFQSCLNMGAYCAGLTPQHDSQKLAQLQRFGHAFGLAFQIADDLIDVKGNTEHAGKRVGKDAARGKLTYPVLLGVEGSQQRMNQLHQEAVTAVSGWGESAQFLLGLVDLVRERTR